MTEIVILGSAASRFSDLVAGVDDDSLTASTPCGESTIGDVLDHMNGIVRGFTAAAAKDLGQTTATPPAPAAANLDAQWRTQIPSHLDSLARAWTDPAAWEGTTQVGGVTLPGAVAGQIALNELVLHGWDLALATGQPYRQDPAALESCLTALSQMYPPEDLERRKGMFGPPVEVPADAPLLDRVVALAGRDPAWAR